MHWFYDFRVRIALALLVAIFSIGPNGAVQTSLAQDDAEAATFDRLWTEATAGEPSFGPEDGTLYLDQDDASFAPVFSAGVSLQNFAAHVEFASPDAPTDTDWRVSLRFRLGQEPHFEFYLNANETWTLRAGTEDILAEGFIVGIPFDQQGNNTIDLLAMDDIGYVAINGSFLTTLPIEQSIGAGDISIGAGPTRADATTNFTDFTIWSGDQTSRLGPTTMSEPEVTGDAAIAQAFLIAIDGQEPIAAPDDGELEQVETDISTVVAPVSLTNFIVHIAFESPYTYSANETPWDAGIMFRTNQTPHFRLIIDSTGRWVLTLGTGDPVQSGRLDNLKGKKGNTNTIDLIVVQDIGYVVINDEYITTLDLSASIGDGPIAFGTSFYINHLVVGAIMPYRDFHVWSLD